MQSKLSIKTRLVFSFAGFTSAMLFLLYFLTSLWYRGNQRDQIDHFLELDASNTRAVLITFLANEDRSAGGRSDPLYTADFARFLSTFLLQRSNKPDSYKTTLLIADSSGHIISISNQALNLDPDMLNPGKISIYDEKTLGERGLLFSVRYEGLDYRILQMPLLLGGKTAGSIRLACLLDPVIRSSSDFLLRACLLFLFSVCLLSLSGFFLATLILRPVRSMSATMNRVTERNLSSRLDLLPGNDELSTLALTFNKTLDRIENAYRIQEQLVSDLSHQLRTPLTSMRGAVEMAMHKTHSVRGYQEILETTIVEIDRITSLVNTMLTYAKLDGYIERLESSPCDLVLLLVETIGDLAPLWDEKSIHFVYRFFRNRSVQEFTPENDDEPLLPPSVYNLCILDLDAFRFKQAVINILDNAYKHTANGGSIAIELHFDSAAGTVRIVIINSGAPIPLASLPHLFSPFYQGESMQNQTLEIGAEEAEKSITGFGLGLSICRRIVEMHQGTIRAFNPETGGAAFEIIVPVRQAPMTN